MIRAFVVASVLLAVSLTSNAAENSESARVGTRAIFRAPDDGTKSEKNSCAFLLQCQAVSWSDLATALQEFDIAKNDPAKITVAMQRVPGFYKLGAPLARIFESIFYLASIESERIDKGNIRILLAQKALDELHGMHYQLESDPAGGNGGGGSPPAPPAPPSSFPPPPQFGSGGNGKNDQSLSRSVALNQSTARHLRDLEINITRLLISRLIEELQKNDRSDLDKYQALSKLADQSVLLTPVPAVKTRVVELVETLCQRKLTPAQQTDIWQQWQNQNLSIDELKDYCRKQLKSDRPTNSEGPKQESSIGKTSTQEQTSSTIPSLPADSGQALTLQRRSVSLDLFYQAGRSGEIDPCACEVSPYGGFDREAGALRYRAGRIYLDGGNLFAPKTLSDIDIEFYRRRAALFVTILNQLQTDCISLGPNDLKLGIDFLKQLEKEAHFPIVCSNLVDGTQTPVFCPFCKINTGGQRLAIMGVVPEGTYKDCSALPLDVAIRACMKPAMEEADVLIVCAPIGSLKQVSDLATKVPEVAIWITAAPDGVTSGEPVGGALVLSLTSGGTHLGHLKSALLLPVRGFYSVDTLEWYRWYASPECKKLSETLGAVSGASASKAESLKKTIAKAKWQLDKFPISGASLFESEQIPLDTNFHDAAISKLLDVERERERKYKSSQQQ